MSDPIKEIDVDRLYVSAVDSKPITVEDWAQMAGEDGEGFHFWETFQFELDGKDKPVDMLASWVNPVGVIVDDVLYEEWSDYQDKFWTECEACNGTGYVRSLLDMEAAPIDGETPECEPCDGWGLVRTFPEALAEDEFGDCMAAEPQMWGSEGPMMNYWYPLDIREDEVQGIATKLVDLPLCVVEVSGSYGLALTGGGMDLSWEICKGFVVAGYLPPVHFSDLPRMAGMTYDTTVLAAMRRSLNTKIGWCQYALERLDHNYAQEGSK